MFKAIGFLALMIVTMVVFSFAGRMFSEPSDVDVLIGVASFIGILMIWYKVLEREIRRFLAKPTKAPVALFALIALGLVVIGSPRPPQAVIDSINGKVKATQDAIRVENEVRQTKAQAEKNIAQAEGEAAAAIAKANGEAKANAIVNSSISPNLLDWRRLEISSVATQKWNGQLPTYSGGTMPFIQLPAIK